jgi:tetratricopeptide (TPR) repeat protein
MSISLRQLRPMVDVMRFRVFASTISLLALSLAAAPRPVDQPLTKTQVIELLKASVSSSRVADLVREKGVDFEPSADDINTLRSIGANADLIDALAVTRVVKPADPDHTARAPQTVNEGSDVGDYHDLDGAIALYQAAIQENPADAKAHRLLGVAYGKKKDWQRDIGEQKTAILLSPNDSAAKAELTLALRCAEAEPLR